MDPARIQLHATRRGLYESFDLRGTSTDGDYAFLIKHVLFKPLLARQGSIEVAAMVFDRQGRCVRCVHERETLQPRQQQQLRRVAGWHELSFSFASGSFLSLARQQLRGKLHSTQGAAAWSLQLQRPGQALQPFPHRLLYDLPWPRYKQRIHDCALQLQGRVQVAGLLCEGEFTGNLSQYWGDGYPHELAHAQCSRFDNEAEALFAGFSCQLAIGRLRTPYLHMASLRWRGQWYHFNDLRQLWRHRLEALDNYRWRVTFLNADYALEVEIDGINPRVTPWLAWHAEHPLGSRSVLKTTPFAQGRLLLYRRDTQAVLAELHSSCIELQTLLPENLPEGGGFLANA